MLSVNRALAAIAKRDPHIKPYLSEVRLHLERYQSARDRLCPRDTALSDIANGYLYFGIHRTEGGWVFREWLPGADAAWLTGDFNDWAPYSHPLRPIGDGVWGITLDGADALRHGQRGRLSVGRKGSTFERIPAYIRSVEQEEGTRRLCGVVWEPQTPVAWTDADVLAQ